MVQWVVAMKRLRQPRQQPEQLQILTQSIETLSASLDCHAENVGIFAVVIPELKLRDVQRHVFGAHLVERTDHTTLEDRPETFDRVGMDGTDHVFTSGVINGAVRIFFVQLLVSGLR